MATSKQANFKPVTPVIFYLDGVDLGAERLLRHPKAHGVPMAVATSTTPALFDLKMSQHRDLVTLFQHVVCTGGGAN
ncbi:hypothetical protein MRX96_039296 [Rhipicephalus microplus]